MLPGKLIISILFLLTRGKKDFIICRQTSSPLISHNLYFSSSSYVTSHSEKAFGFSVRCIID
jgi:hypothetical protein